MPEVPEDLAPSTRAIYAVFDFLGARKKIIFASLSAIVVLAVLANGIYVVKKEEEAVLTRFGKVISSNVPPGLHYALPFVEQAHVRKVMRITRRNVATQNEKGTVSFSMLSGDANLFEADVALQFKIGDLGKYLYATVDPETVLTLIVRERLIDIMGRNYIDLIFTNNRDIIQAHLFKSTTAYLKANDIGIELLALNIVDLQPIKETVAAFRDVSDAIAESIQSVSNARRRTEQLLARSRGQAEAVVMNAKARAKERLMQAGSSAKIFSELLAVYRKQPSSVTVTRYWQRMRNIFRDATLSTVNPGDASAIDINMVDGFVPGVGRMPAGVASAGPSGRPATVRDQLVGGRRSLTTASEKRRHGFENTDSDRFLISGRLHAAGSERHHLSSARPRSLIFDDLSIFSHRHVAPTGVAASAEKNEQPLVNRTTVQTGEEDDEGPARAKKAKSKPVKTAGAKPEKPAKAMPEKEKQAKTGTAKSEK
ncbi:MAG: protease modulator HflK [Rhodospirillaceae bacterium]|nr:protease modulator HflK [Rhodospirillaceae bacterium]